MKVIENFLELVDIEDVLIEDEYVNMVDISVDVDQSFLLSNGLVSNNSAAGAFRKYRDTNTMGAFSLKGKFMNVSDVNNSKLVQNNEVVNIMAAMGLKLGQESSLKDLRYGKILFYTDADCLEENTKIVTKDGTKKISEIDYSDEVLTHSGDYKKVVNIISKDISKYIKISINGNEITCSEDHKLIVYRDGEASEVIASDLKYSDFLLLKDKSWVSNNRKLQVDDQLMLGLGYSDVDILDFKLINPYSIKKLEGVCKFYDIEVEDDHTFFIDCDSDIVLSHNCDGDSITGLLLNFFNRYWPELFDRNMIYKVQTPIVVSTNRKTKKKELFYNSDDYNKWLGKIDPKLWEINYKKGLAALVDDEYDEIINNPKIVLMKKDDLSDKYLDIWFGKSSDLRKDQILK